MEITPVPINTGISKVARRDIADGLSRLLATPLRVVRTPSGAAPGPPKPTTSRP